MSDSTSKSEPKYKYPFLECSNHPGPQRSYAICTHVFRGHERPEHFVKATDLSAGDILCDNVNHEVDDLTLICEGCAIVNGFIPSEHLRSLELQTHREPKGKGDTTPIERSLKRRG